MLPSLQPARPKYPPTAQPPPRPPQHPRQTSHAPAGPSPASSPAAHRSPLPPALSAPAPRSQIEAMPPSPLAPAPRPPSAFAPPPGHGHGHGPVLQPRLSGTPLSQHYDSSVRHPVFFSPALRKPPFPLPDAASGGVNPVAHGYVVENGAHGPRLVRTKL